jgi:hypothetical protein
LLVIFAQMTLAHAGTANGRGAAYGVGAALPAMQPHGGHKSYWTNAGAMTEAEFETAIADIPKEGHH